MTTLNLQVGAGADDVFARQSNTTRWFVSGNWITAGNFNASNRGYAGVTRFTGVTIGQGNTIDAATMVLTVAVGQSVTTCNLDIDALDDDNASMPADYAAYAAAGRTAKVAWDNVPAWPTIDVEKTTPEIKTVIQSIVGRGGWSSGNAIVLSTHDEDETSSTGAWRLWHTYEADSAKATKLDIDYSEAFITGQAALSGTGSLAAVAALTLPAIAVLSGVGTLAAAGTIGEVDLGAAVLSGTGTMSVAGVTTVTGLVPITGVGVLTVLPELIVHGAAVVSGVGTMSVFGEVGLEGRAALAGVGSLSVLAQRIVPGIVALSGVGSLAVAGSPTLVGAATLSGVGTLVVIGESSVTLYTQMGKRIYEIDPADYPSGTLFYLEATMTAEGTGVTAAVRVYNITDAGEVAGSELLILGPGPTWDRTSAFSLPSGAKRYRLEYGGTAGGIYTPHGAALRVASS